jgi:glycosyltransferase involved in cell wall biosynthesis
MGTLPVLLVGDGDQDYAAAVQQDIAARALQGVVRCVGPVADIAPVHAAIDLLVHRASREGLPRVVPEAMLAGRPVVATAAEEGVRDAIPDDRFGAVVALGDADGLGTALGQFLSDPSFGCVLARRAGSGANGFSMAAHRRRLLALYNRWLMFKPAATREESRDTRLPDANG